MKKTYIILVSLLMVFSAARGDIARSSALIGASVTLDGTFFTDDGGWGPGVPADPADLVDGAYQPQYQQWNINSVWWNGYSNPANSILINLAGTYPIGGFSVQADDNDSYRIEYRGLDSLWHTAWNIPAVYTYGLDFREVTLDSSITTSALRVTATGGDGFYAIAEVEAFLGLVDPVGVPDGGAASIMLCTAFALLVAGRYLRCMAFDSLTKSNPLQGYSS